MIGRIYVWMKNSMEEGRDDRSLIWVAVYMLVQEEEKYEFVESDL